MTSTVKNYANMMPLLKKRAFINIIQNQDTFLNDYGPAGTLLRYNILKQWWDTMVNQQSNVFPMENISAVALKQADVGQGDVSCIERNNNTYQELLMPDYKSKYLQVLKLTNYRLPFSITSVRSTLSARTPAMTSGIQSQSDLKAFLLGDCNRTRLLLQNFILPSSRNKTFDFWLHLRLSWWKNVMDADLEIRVTRSGRRARQLVIIPDADISEAEAESEDDVDDPDYGTTVPTVSQDDESDLSTDDDDIPSANLFQTTEPTPSKSRNKNGHNFRWRSMNQPVVDTTWKDVLPDCPDEVGTPISYFEQFFTPDMMQLIVEETNRYAVQNGSWFRINMQNLETYVGIFLRMGIVHMPRYRMYWSSELRYNAIADYMSRNMFEDIGRFIHFNDNSKVITNRKDQNYDSLYKIRPILEKLLQQCLLVAPKQRQSIDEQMIPFKGRNRLRQYLPNKPKRWGFKVIARCCSRTGFTHDFTLYEGKAPELAEGESVGYQPADFVILLCKSLPQQRNYIIYFDNWFNFPELQLRLKQYGFHSEQTDCEVVN
ncbi:PiggyBac transposable element-derived protein 3 [Biomphalaria pfeifferi]|uniref:PiggyBac transposable element-derived protein 3 n=1 Tax=Biomphalaria pfeifferi TaxID=112525 RepID=A0AAD8EZY4_BIOPF|nr:PiggyBac transposable element-derived protein 3 [Biomphalaria pfeifferi]